MKEYYKVLVEDTRTGFKFAEEMTFEEISVEKRKHYWCKFTIVD
jgi:hypothetical protein